MSSFRGLGVGNGADSLSLTVPLTPHVGLGTPTVTAASSGPAEVRLAGVDTKEKMYEPKQRKKLVRVLTVVAYLFFVSLAAAMLSLYYVFLWNPSPKGLARQLTEEQLRAQEQAALRELQRVREQRRLHEQLQLQQRGRSPQGPQQQPQVWASTPAPDYLDLTENAEDDELQLYTEQPAPFPLLRHHGVASAAAEDNNIPEEPLQMRPRAGAAAASSSPGVDMGQAGQREADERVASGYAALRHSSLRRLSARPD